MARHILPAYLCRGKRKFGGPTPSLISLNSTSTFTLIEKLDSPNFSLYQSDQSILLVGNYGQKRQKMGAFDFY
jgi:hypothetical protein